MRSSVSPPSSFLAASIASPSGPKPSPTPTKLSDFVNFSKAPSVSDFRPEPSTDSRARSRNSSLEIGWRAAPMMRKPSGIRPTCERWNIPGSSLRLARSPVAPKRTITWSVFTGWAARSCLALSVVTLMLRRLQGAIRRPIVGRDGERDQGRDRVRPGRGRAGRVERPARARRPGPGLVGGRGRRQVGTARLRALRPLAPLPPRRPSAPLPGAGRRRRHRGRAGRLRRPSAPPQRSASAFPPGPRPSSPRSPASRAGVAT